MNEPITTNYLQLFRSSENPSEIHAKNAYLTRFFEKYLAEKAISVLEFDGIPEHWELNYFEYALFLGGYVGVFDTTAFGPICQHGSLAGDFNIWYQPTKFLVANPALPASVKREYTIGKDCELIRLQPIYSGIWDIISIYADMMALSVESAGINLLNTKFAYVFAADNAAMAQSFKAVIDDILSGRPAAFADKKLFNEDGKLRFDMLVQNLKNIYIQSEILDDLCSWDARFNSEVGIPNVNISKESGVSAEEVNANNIDTKSKSVLWHEQVTRDLEKVNNRFGIDIKCSMRYGGDEDANTRENVITGIV